MAGDPAEHPVRPAHAAVAALFLEHHVVKQMGVHVCVNGYKSAIARRAHQSLRIWPCVSERSSAVSALNRDERRFSSRSTISLPACASLRACLVSARDHGSKHSTFSASAAEADTDARAWAACRSCSPLLYAQLTQLRRM